MTLVIAEKPDLGKAIAAAIMPHRKLRQGYIEGDNMIVTWAFGHLFRLKAPDDYDPALKKWDLATLPIYFENWGIKPDEGKKDQIKLIWLSMPETRMTRGSFSLMRSWTISNTRERSCGFPQTT